MYSWAFFQKNAARKNKMAMPFSVFGDSWNKSPGGRRKTTITADRAYTLSRRKAIFFDLP